MRKWEIQGIEKMQLSKEKYYRMRVCTVQCETQCYSMFLLMSESKHNISAEKLDSENTCQVANKDENKNHAEWPGLLGREPIQASDVSVQL